MTIADKLNYLNGTKEAIKQAIANKGVEVLETDTFRSYADKIASIESSGGSGADYKSSLMATTTQSAYSPSIVSLSDYVLPDYTIEKGQTGLLYPKRTTQPVETENFTKVGDVVIEDKVASGFSGSSYLTTNNTITLGSNFEIKFVFTTGSDITTEQNIFQGRINPYIAIGICYPPTETRRLGYSIGTGSSWISATNYGTNVLKLNTKYYVRLLFTGSEYKAYISENGGNEQLDWSLTSTQIIPAFIGCIGVNRVIENPFKGSIDLSESYIKVNNEMHWEPYTKHIGYMVEEEKYVDGICTKDYIPQAGTNTLNAYHIEYTDGTSECLLGQTEPTGEDIKSVQLLESSLSFEEDKAWTYNEDSEQFE